MALVPQEDELRRFLQNLVQDATRPGSTDPPGRPQDMNDYPRYWRSRCELVALLLGDRGQELRAELLRHEGAPFPAGFAPVVRVLSRLVEGGAG